MAFSGRSRTSSEGSKAFSTTWPATTTLPPPSFRSRHARVTQEQMQERPLVDSRKKSLGNGGGRGAGRCRTYRSISPGKGAWKNQRPPQKLSWSRRAAEFESCGQRVWTHLEPKAEKSHLPEDLRDSSISRTLSSPRYFPNRRTTSLSTGSRPMAAPALALADSGQPVVQPRTAFRGGARERASLSLILYCLRRLETIGKSIFHAGVFFLCIFCHSPQQGIKDNVISIKPSPLGNSS